MLKRLVLPLLILTLAGGCGTAQTAAPLPTEDQIEAAVVQTLLDRAGTGYLSGECVAEGHQILRTDREGALFQVYLLASTGNYGFCTGHFEEISGSGAIPTRITLAEEEDGSLTVTEYWVPQDGSYYADSIKETFPLELQPQALYAHDAYSSLQKQKQAYAQAYLDSIGREAPVGDYGDFDHPLFTDQGMSVEVANALMGIEKLNEYPYYIGNVERVEDGVRMVYETAWEPTGDGTGTATFTRYYYDTGEYLERHTFQVDGDSYTESSEGWGSIPDHPSAAFPAVHPFP